ERDREPEPRRVAPLALARLVHERDALAEDVELAEDDVVLVRVARDEARRAPRAPAAEDDRRARLLHRLRQRRRAADDVVPPLEAKGPPRRRLPEAAHDAELLLEQLETLALLGERGADRRVLVRIPAGAEAELDAAAAHRVDVRDGDRQQTR